jgi:aspartate ammonia-lyase
LRSAIVEFYCLTEKHRLIWKGVIHSLNKAFVLLLKPSCLLLREGVFCRMRCEGRGRFFKGGVFWMGYRMEEDLLGQYPLEEDCYFGIQTARAVENFALRTSAVNPRWVRALALVKKAAALANRDTGLLEREKAEAIVAACEDIITGKLDGYFPVCALQGGAGTSLNMNVNECVANRAIEILGGKMGDYSLVHPLNDVNMSQSTNDAVPTALRIASIELVRELSDVLAVLQDALQNKEEEFGKIAKLGRTQLTDALPMRAGQGFGAYAQAIARDRWRIYKTEERLRFINIGGTAIGTGLNALPKYIFRITDYLQELTGFGLARAESPMDATQNADIFAEVSGLLKACAVNLLKISNDLRLLACGPHGGIGEVLLPELQAGSTIMPGKVNPVVPEMAGQAAMKVIANDTAITMAAAAGQLELNAFLPLIGESLLESLTLLCDAVGIFCERCIRGLRMDEERCLKNLEQSSALSAALIDYIGYDRAAELAKTAVREGVALREVVERDSGLESELVRRIFSLNELTRPGIPGK